jgi:dCMP deaminase
MMISKHISWDAYFMGVAKLSAMRSKDPKTKVGACIVNEDRRIVGIGYNGFPRGCSDQSFPWSHDAAWIDTKYPYVVHAEANAILNATTSLKGASIYVTLFPCNECMKLIIQSGIVEIVYESNKNAHTKEHLASMKMFESASIKMRHVETGVIKYDVFD